MNGHMIIVSIDAMVFEDIEYCKTLPNFSKILCDASTIKQVRTIYPSLTHPVHATLITGNPAGITGIINNSQFNRESPTSDIWYNNLSEINCDTIFHTAKRAGLTTAAASWPVTSRTDVIDYLIPVALNSDFCGYEDNPIDAFRAMGATENVIPIIEDAIKIYGYQDRHPEVDARQIYCSVEIIKTEQKTTEALS